jgi:hypothetical protein
MSHIAVEREQELEEPILRVWVCRHIDIVGEEETETCELCVLRQTRQDRASGLCALLVGCPALEESDSCSTNLRQPFSSRVLLAGV